MNSQKYCFILWIVAVISAYIQIQHSNPNLNLHNFVFSWMAFQESSFQTSSSAYSHFRHTHRAVLSTVIRQQAHVEEWRQLCLCSLCLCVWSRPAWGPLTIPKEHQLCERQLRCSQVYSHRWPQPAGQWALLLSQFIMCSRCPPWLHPWHHTNSPFTTWWHTAQALAHWWHLVERRRVLVRLVHVRV